MVRLHEGIEHHPGGHVIRLGRGLGPDTLRRLNEHEERKGAVLLPAPRRLSFAVAVTTAPRAKETLTTTLADLAAAGFPADLVFAEPGSHASGGWATRWNPTRLGAWPNRFQAIQWFVAEATADYLLVCEDDLIVSRHARDFVETQGVPQDASLCNLYRTGHMSGHTQLEHNGAFWRPVKPGRWVWGSLAMILPRRAAEHLVRDDRINAWAAYPSPNLSDRRLGEWSHRAGRYYISSFSFVDHQRGPSSIGHGGSEHNTMKQARQWYDETA